MNWTTDYAYTNHEEEFEDTKGVIRIRKLKQDRQHNGQKKKVKQRSTKHTHKTKDRVTQTPLKTGGELRCSRRVSSSVYHSLVPAYCDAELVYHSLVPAYCDAELVYHSLVPAYCDAELVYHSLVKVLYK
jgi:hypothetical protein